MKLNDIKFHLQLKTETADETMMNNARPRWEKQGEWTVESMALDNRLLLPANPWMSGMCSPARFYVERRTLSRRTKHSSRRSKTTNRPGLLAWPK